MSNKPNRLKDAFSVLWPLALALVAIAVAWGSSKAQADSNTERIITLEQSQKEEKDKTNDILTGLLVGQAQIQTDLSYIKRNIK